MTHDFAAIAADIEIDCPRCGQRATVRFHGPCPTCFEALRSRYSGQGRDDVVVAEYEPKMNVTPNAVATKE